MRKLVIAASLATFLLFAGLSVALAEGMDTPAGSSNNQAAGAAGVAGVAGLVAGAAASGAGTDTPPDTAPAGANAAAGSTPPDDSTPPDNSDDGATPGEGTPGPEEPPPPSPECVACQAAWDVLAGQRTQGRSRLKGGLVGLSNAYSHERSLAHDRDQLVSERNQALALGGAAIAVAMAYGGVIAARFASAASAASTTASNLAGLEAVGYGSPELTAWIGSTSAQSASLTNTALAVGGVDLAGGAGAAAAMWAKINQGLTDFDAAVETSKAVSDQLEALCHQVEGDVKRIDGQLEGLKAKMAECGFNTDLDDEYIGWPQRGFGSIQG